MSQSEVLARVREPATVRVAMWSSRHRWPVAAAWFLATIGNWWLPGFLRWLPRVTIEGEPEADTRPHEVALPSA